MQPTATATTEHKAASTMKKLILHIGRHKTGTSAIQDCLIKNPQLLKSNGYYYPTNARKGRGHHHVSEPNAGLKNRIRGLFIMPKLPTDLKVELDEHAGYTSIISSEAFQRCHPKLIKRLFEGYDINVVVYLRNHVDYIASAYTQWVHATGYKGSFERYYLTSYSANYYRFLRQWELQFPGKLLVRKFENNSLANGDISSDFLLHGLGIKIEDFSEISKSHANPSLNNKVMQLKLHLNRTGEYKTLPPDRLYNTLPMLNTEFPAGKVKTPRVIAKHVIKKNRKRDMKVARRFFSEDTLFRYRLTAPEQHRPLNKHELEAMKKTLLELMRSNSPQVRK